MELRLICPQCRTTVSLATRLCQSCGTPLGDLPSQERRYLVVRSSGDDAPPHRQRQVLATAGETVQELEPMPEYRGPDTASLDNNQVSLCEALDRILHKGAVIFGEVLISVADIDLIYLGLQVILSSVETARGVAPMQNLEEIRAL